MCPNTCILFATKARLNAEPEVFYPRPMAADPARIEPDTKQDEVELIRGDVKEEVATVDILITRQKSALRNRAQSRRRRWRLLVVQSLDRLKADIFFTFGLLVALIAQRFP